MPFPLYPPSRARLDASSLSAPQMPAALSCSKRKLIPQVVLSWGLELGSNPHPSRSFLV